MFGGKGQRMSKEENLGEFEQLVLLAVLRLGKCAYGARIQQELEDRSGRKASVSSIYITLTRLEGKGMVASWMGEPTGVRGGKARRFFRVEPKGMAALEKAREQLLAMWDGVRTAPEGSGS
jgi:PadR family transcriptional regulator PadR